MYVKKGACCTCGKRPFGGRESDYGQTVNKSEKTMYETHK